MLRINDCIKEFKNGNINIKYDPDTIKEAGKRRPGKYGK